MMICTAKQTENTFCSKNEQSAQALLSVLLWKVINRGLQQDFHRSCGNVKLPAHRAGLPGN